DERRRKEQPCRGPHARPFMVLRAASASGKKPMVRELHSAPRRTHAIRDAMRRPPWKTLVSELKDSGYQSPYLDRLRQRLDVEQAYATLEQEVVQEIAAALGRTAATLDLALLRLELAGPDLDAAATAPDVASCPARF